MHLYPKVTKDMKKIPPRSHLTIGEISASWVIKKPFGENQIVVMATDKPLLDKQRPMEEPAQDYLALLHQKVIVNETPVAAKYLMVNTNPRT